MMIGNALKHYKSTTSAEALKSSLNKYKNQVHGTAKTTPNNAQNLNNVVHQQLTLFLLLRPSMHQNRCQTKTTLPPRCSFDLPNLLLPPRLAAFATIAPGCFKPSQAFLPNPKVREAERYGGAIEDAWRQQLNICKLLPFCAATICCFAEYCGIDRCFVFGFITTLTGWVLHRDVHALFNPLQPEHEVRPRIFTTLIAEPNSGKSPFFKHCLEAVFVSKPGKPALVDALQPCFASPGPGKDKTLFVQSCTNSDFARRMKAADGHLFWMSEEAWSALDTAWAKGRNKVKPTERKIEHAYLQNTQNGQSYGPLSINAEQFYIPTTNFATFLCGQAKVIHDYWGMSFVADCPFNSMGWEFRPTFLWPTKIPEPSPEEPHVTFQGAARCLLDVLGTLARSMGQTLDSRNFHTSPIHLDAQAQSLWRKFHTLAEREKDSAPAFASGAIGKHCFTTTSHVTVCHLFQQAFEHIQENQDKLCALRSGSADGFQSLQIDGDFVTSIASDSILAAPEHLNFMLHNSVTIYNEMKLPKADRAGPQMIDEEAPRQTRRRAGPASRPPPQPLAQDDSALSILLQKHIHDDSITLTQANRTIPARLGFRSNKAAVERLFDLAASYGAGIRSGSSQGQLRLKLTLENMDPVRRQHLNLPLSSMPLPEQLPQMHGAGKVAKSLTQKVPSMPGGAKKAKNNAEAERGNSLASRKRPAANAADASVANKRARAQPKDGHSSQATAAEEETKHRQLCPDLKLEGPPLTATAVQESINKSLAEQGKTFQIKAYAQKRKHGFCFELKCASCHYKTCTWKGFAFSPPRCDTLSSYELANKAHGDPKPKAKSGRKSRGSRAPLRVTESVAYHGAITPKAFMKALIKHFQDKPGAASLKVLCRSRKPTKKGLVCSVSCSTHCNLASKVSSCPWTAMATLFRSTATTEPYIRLRCSPPDTHAPDFKKRFGTLTHPERMVAIKNLASTNKTIQRLVGKINSSKKTAKHVTSFLLRLRAKRKKETANTDAVPHTNKRSFQASDFEFLRDRLNASLPGSTSLSSSDPCLVRTDNCLRCVNLHVSPDGVCAPLICPLLMHLTLSLLPHPWCLKLSTDGTYRLLFDQYTLLTIGVNVKNYSQLHGSTAYAFRSSFVPLAFCFAHVEDGDAYAHFSRTVLEAASTIGHALDASHVFQFHGDLHKGIEAARAAVFPNSQRLSDWAHVTGATSQGPSGLHGFCHQAFGDSDMTPFLLQWCRISKTMTLLLFHEVWSQIFNMLENRGHDNIASNMQRHYFQRVEAPHAGMVWSASWRSGPDRIMPGSDVGSAPQERWHGQSLKPSFSVQKYEPFELASLLQETIVEPQLRSLQAMVDEGDTFQDWPAIGQFVDQHILHNSSALAKYGRAPPQSLLALNLHQSFQDEDSNVWTLVPKAPLKVDWSKSGRKKVYKDRVFALLPPNAVQEFAAMITANSSLQITRAWQNLGLYESGGRVNWKAAAKMFDDWNVVLSGPLTQQFWQLHHSNARSDASLHAIHLCFNCSIAARWGPCEHMYASMLHQNLINESSIPRPKAKGRPAKKKQAAAPPSLPENFQLAPGPGLERPPASASACSLTKSTKLWAPLSADQLALQTLLRRADCGHMLPAMLQQQATVEALKSFTIADFVAIFGCNVGCAHRIMIVLQNAHASDQLLFLCQFAYMGLSVLVIPFFLAKVPTEHSSAVRSSVLYSTATGK